MRQITIISTIILLFLVSNTKTKAQKILKYKDVYEVVALGNNKISYPLLMKFRSLNPTHANAYFHLGEIAYKRILRLDPFTDIEIMRYYNTQATVYYGLAKMYADDKEVKKNRAMYAGVQVAEGQKRLEFTDVHKHIDQKQARLEQHKKEIENIRNLLYSANSHYKNCIRIFTEIISENSKEKNLYMSQDESLIENTKKLKFEFAATLSNLDNYKDAIKSYPIGNYKQNYSLKPIKTYRLEGLLNSNFLDNNIVLWDYKLWVDALNKTWEVDMALFRKDIVAAYDQAELEIDKANSTAYSVKKYKPYVQNKKLVNQIEKYDFGSMLSNYFRYTQSKVRYTQLNHSVQNNPELDSVSTLVQTANYYRSLIELKGRTDSLHQTTMVGINKKGYTKYKQFIDEKYNNFNGYKLTLKGEERQHHEMLENSFERFKQFMINDLKDFAKLDSFVTVSETDSIALFRSQNTAEAGNHSLLFAETQNSVWVVGFNRTNKKTSLFITHATDTNTVISHKVHKKLVGFDTYAIIPTKAQFIDNYMLVLLHAIPANPEDTAHNILAKFDVRGNLKSKTVLPNSLYPRFFQYDDINDQLIVVYKGKKTKQAVNKAQELVTTLYDNAGTVLWENKLTLKGAFADVIKSGDKWLVFANYSEYLLDGSVQKADTKRSAFDQTNLLLNYLNNKGESMRLTKYPETNSYIVTRVLKLDSETFNMVGLKGTWQPNSKLINSRKPFFTMLTNQTGFKKYAN